MSTDNLATAVVYGKVWRIHICATAKKYCGIKLCWSSIILVNLLKRNFPDGLKTLLRAKLTQNLLCDP